MHTGCCFAAEIEDGPNGNGPEGPFAAIANPKAACVIVSVASGSQPLRRGVMMVLHSILVPTHLTIELVHQLVDRCVEIFV